MLSVEPMIGGAVTQLINPMAGFGATRLDPIPIDDAVHRIDGYRMALP
jgi:hypothetical protein